jgi:hypothetical protein
VGALGAFLPPYFKLPRGADAPSGSGYTKIYSNREAFATLTRDGLIKTWGDVYYGGKDAPNAPTVHLNKSRYSHY